MAKGIKELVKDSRSIRRFKHSEPMPMEVVLELVDTARFTPSAANKQPLRYVLCTEPELNQKIFDCLTWAAALPDWPGPAPEQRPAAYIVILEDSSISGTGWMDQGIAAQTMLLAAREKGYGGCMLAAVNRRRLAEVLDLQEEYKILLVLALGKPAEEIILEEAAPGQNLDYYRDEQDVHHVPKRSLQEMVLARY
ncbi:MAG: nitroreductase family protein [Thermodesulfobacteriota bacterium]